MGVKKNEEYDSENKFDGKSGVISWKFMSSHFQKLNSLLRFRLENLSFTHEKQYEKTTFLVNIFRIENT